MMIGKMQDGQDSGQQLARPKERFHRSNAAVISVRQDDLDYPA